jgi:hypothetical protein
MIDKFLAWLNPAPAPEPEIRMQALPITVGESSPAARRNASRLSRLLSIPSPTAETLEEIKVHQIKLEEQGFIAPKSVKECDILIDNL